MRVTNLTSVLPPEEVHKHFVLEDGKLYRKLASGAATRLRSMDSNLVVTIFEGHRLVGVDIAWCLIYGNWPEYPVVQIKADPLDFSEGNLFPARVKRLRYTLRKRAHLFTHPLSEISHLTPEKCRKHWEDAARDHYLKDLSYVLRVEAYNRTMRETYLRETASIRLPKAEPARRGVRPPPVMGKEWHWYKQEWISVPVACHVADDYRRRIEAQKLGAVRFEFDPGTRMVRAYDQAGAEVRPA